MGEFVLHNDGTSLSIIMDTLKRCVSEVPCYLNLSHRSTPTLNTQQCFYEVLKYIICIRKSALSFNIVTRRSYDSPLHHHLARRRRRPHHLHPLNAPAAGNSSKQMKTLKANHPKSYTYHYNQQQAVRHLGNHSQPLSHHRRSLSHVIPSSWRTELYYDSDNYYRGTF